MRAPAPGSAARARGPRALARFVRALAPSLAPFVALCCAACGRTDAQWRADLLLGLDPYRRSLACAALSEAREPELAAGPLVHALGDPARGVRGQAAHALGALPPETLAQWLAGPELEALTPDARQGLADVIARAEPAVQAAFARELALAREPARLFALASLAHSARTRELALRRLLGLLPALEDEELEQAVKLLRHLRAGGEVLPALASRLGARPAGAASDGLGAFLVRLLAEELERTPLASRAARLAELGGAPELARICVAALFSPRRGVPLHASRALWSALEVLPPQLFEALAREPERGAAERRALLALALDARLEAEPALAALADDTPAVRACALFALAARPPAAGTSAHEALRAAAAARLKDPSPLVRRAAHHASAALAGDA